VKATLRKFKVLKVAFTALTTAVHSLRRMWTTLGPRLRMGRFAGGRG
jgi:hypothetical protein